MNTLDTSFSPMEEDLFPCDHPDAPSMADIRKRRDTFRFWPNLLFVSIEYLIEAGFYYLGRADKLKCFYCGGGLKDWRRDDDPWVEHAKWYPHCEYMLRKRGPEFVSDIGSRFPNITLPSGPAASQYEPTPNHTQANRNVEQIEHETILPTNTWSQENNFEAIFRENFIETNQTTRNHSIQINSINSSIESNQSSNSIECNENNIIQTTSRPSIVLRNSVITVRGQSLNLRGAEGAALTFNGTRIQVSAHGGITVTGANGGNYVYTNNSSGSEYSSSEDEEEHRGSEVESQLITLGYSQLEINAALSRLRCRNQEVNLDTALDELQLTSGPGEKMESTNASESDIISDGPCVICLSNKKEMILVPCGHFCSCRECGRRLAKCPICRANVERIVRVFGA